jgi:hypothetical protein
VAAKLAPTGTSYDYSVFTNDDTIRTLIRSSLEKKLNNFGDIDPDDVVSCVLINTAEGALTEEVVNEINTKMDGVRAVQTGAMVSGLGQSLSGFTDLFRLLTIFVWILALVILFVIFRISVSERKREFAVLRVIGASGSRLAGIVFTRLYPFVRPLSILAARKVRIDHERHDFAVHAPALAEGAEPDAELLAQGPAQRDHVRDPGLPFGDSAGFVHDHRIYLCNGLHSVSTLKQDILLRACADTGEKCQGYTEHQSAGTGDDQKGAGGFYPILPVSGGQRRSNCHQKCQRHYNGGIHPGEAGDKAINLGLGGGSVFHAFQNPGDHGGFQWLLDL